MPTRTETGPRDVSHGSGGGTIPSAADYTSPEFQQIRASFIHLPMTMPHLNIHDATTMAGQAAKHMAKRVADKYEMTKQEVEDTLEKELNRSNAFTSFLNGNSASNKVGNKIRLTNEIERRAYEGYTSGQEISLEDLGITTADGKPFVIKGSVNGQKLTEQLDAAHTRVSQILLEPMQDAGLRAVVEKSLASQDVQNVNNAYRMEKQFREAHERVVFGQKEAEAYQLIQAGEPFQNVLQLMQPIYDNYPDFIVNKPLAIQQSKATLAREAVCVIARTNPGLAASEMARNPLYKDNLGIDDIKAAEHFIAASKVEIERRQRLVNEQDFITRIIKDSDPELKKRYLWITNPQLGRSYTLVDLEQDIKDNRIKAKDREPLAALIGQNQQRALEHVIKQAVMEEGCIKNGFYPTTGPKESDELYKSLRMRYTNNQGLPIAFEVGDISPTPVYNADGELQVDKLGKPEIQNLALLEAMNLGPKLPHGSITWGLGHFQSATIGASDVALNDLLDAVGYCEDNGLQEFCELSFGKDIARSLREAVNMRANTTTPAIIRKKLMNTGSFVVDKDSPVYKEFKKQEDSLWDYTKKSIREMFPQYELSDDYMLQKRGSWTETAPMTGYNKLYMLGMLKNEVAREYGHSLVNGPAELFEPTYKPIEQVLGLAPTQARRIVHGALKAELPEIKHSVFEYKLDENPAEGGVMVGSRENKITNEKKYGICALQHLDTNRPEDQGKAVVRFLPIGGTRKDVVDYLLTRYGASKKFGHIDKQVDAYVRDPWVETESISELTKYMTRPLKYSDMQSFTTANETQVIIDVRKYQTATAAAEQARIRASHGR